jgi:hypothetical protein
LPKVIVPRQISDTFNPVRPSRFVFICFSLLELCVNATNITNKRRLIKAETIAINASDQA